MSKAALKEFSLRMGDNCLILGQRVSAWCGHGPALEEDIALANVSLDLIGQTRMWLGYAAELSGKKATADTLAFLRDSGEFRNALLVEQPNGDIGQTLMRQFLFDAWHQAMLERLVQSSEPRVAEIAQKALKEVAYHLERAADLVVRLGDGTAESRRRMQDALDLLWPYTGELFEADKVELSLAKAGVAPNLDEVRDAWNRTVDRVLADATLSPPETVWMQTGGKSGRHTEHLGYLLAEMQVLQRAHPGAAW